MDGESKWPRPDLEGVVKPEARPYEPPAIVWEEELKAIAAQSCTAADAFDCGGPGGRVTG